MVANGTVKGISFADLVKRETTTVVHWNGTEIELRYNPQAYSSKVHADIQNADLEDDVKSREFISALLTGWNLADDDGVEVPATADNVDALGLIFRSAVLEAIQRHAVSLKNGPNSRRG